MTVEEPVAVEMETLYLAGHSMPAIGKKFKLTRAGVHRILKARGLKKTDKIKAKAARAEVKLDEQIKKYGKRIKNLVALAWSQTRIAKKLDISASTVAAIMKALELEPVGPKSKHSKEEVIEALKGAESLVAAAAKLKLAHSSYIYRLIHRYKLYDLAKTAHVGGYESKITPS